ncbi:MAG: exodeoxyribonuclease VII small subunit [Victivallaceae bacterium]
MKKKSAEEPAMPEVTFEQAFADLEILVAKMDAGQLPLDEMIKYYEQGRRLADFCRDKLTGFEKKIQLLKQDDGKDGLWSDFTPGGERVRESDSEMEIN